MKTVALRYLGTPAHQLLTTVPCERLFSLAGNIVTQKRASLLPDNVEKLVCMASWQINKDGLQELENV